MLLAKLTSPGSVRPTTSHRDAATWSSPVRSFHVKPRNYPEAQRSLHPDSEDKCNFVGLRWVQAARESQSVWTVCLSHSSGSSRIRIGPNHHPALA